MALNADTHFRLEFNPKYATISLMAHVDAVYDELIKFYWCLCFALPTGISSLLIRLSS